MLLGNQYDNWAVVSRFLPNGILDTDFATGGRIVVDTVTKVFGSQVAVDTEGRIVVAGNARPGGVTSNQDLALFRLLNDGSFDPDFGDGGIVFLDGTLAVGGTEAGQGLAIDNSDDIYVAGRAGPTADAGGQALLWKLSGADGSLMPEFGSGGYVVLSDQGEGSFVLIYEDKLLVVGSVEGPVDRDIAIWRVTTSGILAPLFDSDGLYRFDTGLGAESAASVALDSAGRMVIVGRQTESGLDASRAIITRLRFTD